MPAPACPPPRESCDGSAVARPAGLARLPELSALALASTGEDRKRIVLSVLADLLRRSAGDELYIEELVVETRVGEKLGGGENAAGGSTLAAAVAIRTAADSASLIAVGTRPELTSERGAAAVRQLLGELHRRLADAGVAFVQAMREPEVEQPALAACGYECLATLDYLVASARDPHSDLAQRTGKASAAGRLHAIPVERFFPGPAVQEGLVALVEATYVGSLDCPQLEGLRSAAAMLDTYRGSANHDPEDWLVLADGKNRPLGCLLSTPHLAAGSLEITYMGLVPEARGLGYAATILERAWETAERHRLPQLTLAVDRANYPAIKLYQRHGFERLMSEAVWGRGLKSEREISSGGQPRPEGT